MSLICRDIHASGLRKTFTVSLLAMAVHALLNPMTAQAADNSSNTQQDLVVDATTSGDNTAQDKQDYQVKTTRAGTKLLLTPRDVPQSVSVVTQQRMQDQQLQTINDVLNNATGITSSQDDSERAYYYSRGFQLTNFTFDGIPTSMGDSWNYGDTASDTAIYDRIEIVRGATGLMTGAGSPAASVNMVRKHADSKDFTGTVSASYGSWNKQRYVADLSAPLNESGSVRGRVIAGYQDQDSWLDRYHKNTKFLYGTLDADLTDNTTLSLAYDYQDADTRDPTWGGNPVFYSNGSLTHYRRSLNSSADWTYYHTTVRKVYADLVHNFDNGWSFRLNGTHAENTFSDKLLYVGYMAYPDETTGEGADGFGSKDRGKRELTSVDGYASGPFELFGRQHQLMAGVSYSRQHNSTYSSDGVTDEDAYDIATGDIGVFNNHWNGNIAEPEWSDWYQNADDVVRQKSAYTAARFSLADPLSLIVGARYTQYSTNGSSGNMEKNNITPYAGVVYDINDTWSAYASYTSIFQPQTYRDASGHYLTPVTGKSYETGLKSAWFDGRLTATMAIFRIEQNNVGEEINGVYVNNSSEQAYTATKGARSKGAEFELNGALTDNLQMTFGATRYVARDADGRYNPGQPQTEFKLFTRYQLPMLPELTIGGGINWQNRVFEDDTAPDGSTQRVYQGSYPLANLFARYQVTKQVAVQANVDNLFDRTYYSYMNNYVYGEPRNFSVSVSYQF
ncbi:ferric-rhodotorulic acid/ferric-coprogen receptor FhuE [Pantoea cypripedii]|uniref:Ferric-rhodotorulic acid/ferric-coprogen receptor FhuE n=1 Tax=Pantoea cypripedii TaxID=55209 RepID=A0A1X1EGD5_PANCY|nr:ferric-rhodotorulic acid/ferric-coprogen receptor FhuE [Pantoea cypripedii]MBP2199854.1 outer membrane receptor for ferric coprogen and ferric-rhodotorulic acid [Pantoea cypripedii]ORM87882.1 ferric-rhodotorulic acid/ferric-coprogen receptor FhuE [Pantoea cypripedii]